MTKYICALFALSFFALNSCSDFLDEDPRSFIAPTNFYQTDGDAIAAANGIYDILTRPQMYGHEGMIIYGDIASDIAGSSVQAAFIQQGYDDYTFNADDPTLNSFYRDTYTMINRANTVISEVSGSTSISEATANQVVGEASFLRALGYFNLVRVFGDVVLRTSEASGLDLELPRSPASQVYDQIIADLELAEKNLPTDLEAGGRATAWAAKALLAKVHLTLENFNDAATKANEVIEAGFELNPDFGDVFNLNNVNPQIEVIFDIKFSFPNELNQFPRFFITRDLSSIPGYGGDVFGVFIVTDELVTSFSEDDLRRDFTIWTNGERVGDASIEFQEPGLNKLIRTAIDNPNAPVTQSGVNSFPVLRYADVLLMYAEAVNQGGSAGSLSAEQALNAVRSRAGLADLTGLSGDAFRNAVLEERKLELAGEGHRWFDLKRTNNLSNELGGLGFQTGKNEVFPIPQAILNINDQLMQNPGYN